jgi:predicted RNA-binding protein YlxR (DUF448 family)
VTHVPERTCAGCRARAPRGSLQRIVRGPDGVRVDPSGTTPGRGAWVHRSEGCVDAALAKGGLARALRTSLGADELGRLRDDIETGAA